MAKRVFTVILDQRNRELKYLWPGDDVREAIRKLKARGKKPMRTIMKEK